MDCLFFHYSWENYLWSLDWVYSFILRLDIMKKTIKISITSFVPFYLFKHPDTQQDVLYWGDQLSNNFVRVIMSVKVNALWVSLVTWYYSRSWFKEHWRPFIFEFSSGNELCLKAVTGFDPFALTFTQSGHFCTYLVMSTKLSSMQLITNKKRKSIKKQTNG